MTIGVPESPDSDSALGIREFVAMFSIETLVRTADDGRPMPGLAARWTWDDNYTKLRIHLRQGIVLHDGRPLDAALATAVLKPAIDNPSNRALYPTLTDIVSIAPDGDRDIVIDLARPSQWLLGDLTLPLRTGEDGLIGTGPFRVVSSSGSEAVLARFDAYHQGTPTAERIVVKSFDTLRTAWTSMLRGEVDVVSDVPADAVEFVRNDDVQLIRYPRRYQLLMAFNSGSGPLRVPAVRRALNMAVDRHGIVERVLQAGGTVSAGAVWPEFWAYDPSVPPIPFEPRQAADLLDAAGYPLRPSRQSGAPPARFRFTCLIPRSFSVWERVALEIQKDLREVGVEMQLEALSFDQFNRRIGSGEFDAVLVDMLGGPTPDRAYAFWRSRRSHQGRYNVFGYENPEAERLFAALSGATNEAAVRSATRRLQDVLLDDPPALYVAWTTRARAIRRAFALQGERGDPLLSLWKWMPAPTGRVALNP